MANKNGIHWKRISAEAIVVGILLAFAIDAWWDDFQQQHTHRDYDSADLDLSKYSLFQDDFADSRSEVNELDERRPLLVESE